MKNGWIEKHERQRVAATLKAQFRLLNPAETRELQAQASYRQTGLKQLAELSKDSAFHRAILKDLFLSELHLLSQNPLTAGEKAEILLQLPQHRLPLTLLAVVGEVKTTLEMGRNLFHGPLQVLAIHKDDVDRLSRSLLQQQAN
jgi:hypothetical protein